MAYDGKLLARARTQLENIRMKNAEEQRQRRQRVYLRIPEMEDMELELRRQMLETVRLTIAKAPDMAEKIAAIREENLELQALRAERLTEHGFGMDYLDEIICCHKCRDTGIYKGGVCECLDRLYNMELTKELGTLMRRGDECFESFDLSLYPCERDAASGLVPRETMSDVYEFCRRYAENFEAATKNLLFQGGTGLGKTYLSACIARVVARKGFSVCYETAASALEYYEKAKFSRDIAEGEEASLRVKRMESCDLMILDDLGTEMLTPMSQSALYGLINNRLVNEKKTIISTNFGSADLQKRYIPQIYSRLRGEYTALPFVGKDIRVMKKGL